MVVFSSDIDGTLMFDGKVKDIDLQAIKQFQNKHLFGVCTGRAIAMLKDIYPLNLDFYIASSGAIILDKDKNIIKQTKMDKQSAKQIFESFKNRSDIIIQTGNKDVFYATKDLWGSKCIKEFSEIEHEDIYGISLVVESEEIAYNYNQELKREFLNVSGHQNKNSIDIVDISCSKGNAARYIKEYYKASTSAGIGDSYNDLSLLENVDLAYTFKDSPDCLKQQGTVVENIAQAILMLED